MTKITVEAVALWMIPAVLTASMAYILFRRGKISAFTASVLPLLVFYLFFVLTITIFDRVPEETARYELELFWSYKRAFNGYPKLLWQNFWNVVLFMPFGVVGAVASKKHPWLIVLICLLLSVGIEVSQLITHRGLFEFDDMFHNTLGAGIGVALYVLVRRLSHWNGSAGSKRKFDDS